MMERWIDLLKRDTKDIFTTSSKFYKEVGDLVKSLGEYIKLLGSGEDKYAGDKKKLRILKRVPNIEIIEYVILEDQYFGYLDKCMNILIFKIEVLMEHKRILQQAQQYLFDERKVVKGIIAQTNW